LISYTIEQLDPTLQVKEAAPGSGALCGSTYLNRRFQEFLVSKLGQEEGFDDETVGDAMKKFDEEVCCTTNSRELALTVAPLDQERILPQCPKSKLLGLRSRACY